MIYGCGTLTSCKRFLNAWIPSRNISSWCSITASSDDLGEASTALIQAHGRPILRAILCGFAGVAPRSATQNPIELPSVVATKFPVEMRAWMNDILFANDFVPSKATPEAKRTFVKAISYHSLDHRRKRGKQRNNFACRPRTGRY
ncbi:hypothetical protein M405DRAFT_409557 [Rhizopogon salebrosus TDB-379]|nr:hypothetical protein M405DRAFT_409557 [Rhizopogon salebrosus TDB-379]